ncbi:hypothetical protein NQ318_015010 [Aromia moschata]|uniref:Uncharacterized protein n=1 Tax=Aromia moschata TaxID=1265417 RepID=A0AAV8YXE9_9CUCU|nr:hypothetical protein NQ318_015010 [Aromia moschata]
MAEGSYEYECMRAELLGLDKPDYEEFMRNKADEESKREAEEEEADIKNLQEVDHQLENLGRISGGLEELNSILKKTQYKITRFKASCGSLTSLLKRRDSKCDSSSSQEANSQAEEAKVVPNDTGTTGNRTEGSEAEKVQHCTSTARKSDLAKALDKDFDRIDSMIEKAENAQYSMAHQRKQMKKFME